MNIYARVMPVRPPKTVFEVLVLAPVDCGLALGLGLGEN